MPRSARPRERLNTARLVAAAADLADEAGFAALTPTALARRVGVTVPSLYAHVTGAQDLRAKVALRALQELADQVAAALAGRSGRRALAALGQAHRAYARRHPGRWAATTVRLSPQEAASSAGPRLAGLLRDALSSYDLRGDEQTHAVRLVGSVLRGFVDLDAAGGFDHSPPEPDASWDRAVDALHAVLSAWPADGRTPDDDEDRA